MEIVELPLSGAKLIRPRVFRDSRGFFFESYSAGRYAPPRGFRADHRWGRGERLPQAYRGRTYVVDHRRYGLKAPPRGYEYVRVGNDVVLTAVATGLIASVVANLFQ